MYATKNSFQSVYAASRHSADVVRAYASAVIASHLAGDCSSLGHCIAGTRGLFNQSCYVTRGFL